MAKKKKQKIRATFRKNRQTRTRKRGLTGEYREHGFEQDDTSRTERVSGKGELTRKRTVVGIEPGNEETGLAIIRDVDASKCLAGTVLRSGGLHSTVRADDGETYQCATRRILKTLATDQRHVVAAGDRVLFRPERNNEGVIERVEPRHGVLCRTSRGRQHVLVANVDQLLIISSAAEPVIKPHLIDRFLVTAEKWRIAPVICINKIDLINPADMQPLVGVYARMGYRVVLLSVQNETGVDEIRDLVRGRQSVFMGQSGVGKSSLLNLIETNLQLRVNVVSEETKKGKHTTTAAQLIPLEMGGYVVDTPGLRQFQLWDIIPEEVIGFFRDLRPYVNLCQYPDCTHTHEGNCAIKHAVADGALDARRYESYCQMFTES
jgi:ribosome biogenesis GTPase